MKSILLRVAIDKGCGGVLAPIHDDGSFHYIPIPEDVSTSSKVTYKNTTDVFGNNLSDFVPNKTKEMNIHFDPDFESFSYGEPSRPKLSQLLTLEKGDRLFFYAGLQPSCIHDLHSRIFLIGFFSVKDVLYFSNLQKEDYIGHIEKYGKNAHFFRNLPDKELVVVLGDKKKSRLFKKAVPLSDAGLNHPYTLPDLSGIGYSGSLLRAVGHKLDEEGTVILNDWIEEGPASLVNDSTSLFCYTVKSDSGFAPNPNGGYLTLACQEPQLRKLAKKGDWLLGFHAEGNASKGICFLARVSETLSFEDYFQDKRFKGKKIRMDPDGDNIYSLKNVNQYKQVVNRHHGIDQIKEDTSTDKVLVCSLFYYFGKKGRNWGDSKNLDLGLHGFHRITSKEYIQKIIKRITANNRLGIHSIPADVGFVNYLSKWC